ncbi:NADPH-dependent F420 reductase [Undibacterium sp.]|uniref:NADPH-dependent F420 reductase n=1 Tax=Undibacterium sp. TaxID=1914977 RepID=UPI0027320B07|nr:NAD(P)-binding domain-containing protein [Undibacterium sp.]MDP1979530.1 NAD(P)-binding domain-containing protein [Undibacterium sp.]
MSKIGIIGSGNIGGTLTRLFTKAGHDVAVANSRGPSSLQDLANETGASPVTITQAVQDSEIVVVTIPMIAVASLPKDLFSNAPADLIVIDTSNYYPQHRDGLIVEVEAGMTESAWVEQQLGRPVIKVFNSILADHLLNMGKPDTRTNLVALAVAGDDVKAKTAVMHLVEEIGFEAVDAGSIAQSWRQQPGSPGYLKDYDAAGVRKALSEASQERTPEWRATVNSPGTFESPA